MSKLVSNPSDCEPGRAEMKWKVYSRVLVDRRLRVCPESRAGKYCPAAHLSRLLALRVTGGKDWSWIEQLNPDVVTCDLHDAGTGRRGFRPRADAA